VTAILPYLVFLHVLSVVLAFGPTYAYAYYAGLAEQEPQHLGFNNRARTLVSRQLTIPATIAVFVTGVLIILIAGLPLFHQSYRWLLISIIAFVGGVLYTVAVTWRVQRRISALAARRARGTPPFSDAEAAEFRRLIHHVRRDGKAMGILVVVILFLMVVKPTFRV
jgi:uncharacterized membrane protein